MAVPVSERQREAARTDSFIIFSSGILFIQISELIDEM
jgi:hypothetical protein